MLYVREALIRNSIVFMLQMKKLSLRELTPNHSAREQQSPLLKSGLTLKTRFLTTGGLAKLLEELAPGLDSEGWLRMGPEAGGQGKAGRGMSASKSSEVGNIQPGLRTE